VSELGNKFPAQSLNPLKRVQTFTSCVIILNSVVPNRDYTLFLCGLMRAIASAPNRKPVSE